MAGGFGRSWWGRAWLDALLSVAEGQDGRLARGRRLARTSRHTPLAISPGGAEATFEGGAVTVHVGIRTLRDDEWDAVIDSIAGRAGHAAALLEGGLPTGVVEDAASVEVDLLPRPRDLRTTCTCPDDVEPCIHAAAVCFLLADALDADPFVLLLLRGLRREEVLEMVRTRRRAADPSTPTRQVPGPAGADTGVVDAREAWGRQTGPLPHPPPLTDGPGRPPPWPSGPPSHVAFDGAGLRALALDAARRAWALRAGLADSGLGLDHRSDLARRAADTDDAGRATLAANAGMAPVDLDCLAEAWVHGGASGVRAHDEARWDPPPDQMARARDRIADAGLSDRRVHLSGNRITGEGRLQFRLARDGRWYRFTKDSGRWSLAAPPGGELDDVLDVGS